MRFLNAVLLTVLAIGLATPALATFQLTKGNAYGFIIDSDVRKRAIQRMTLHITAANTDTGLDLQDDTGTFWTAVGVDATYGDIGDKMLEAIQKIDDRAIALNGIFGLTEYGTFCHDTNHYCDTAATDETTEVYDDVTCSGIAATDEICGVTLKTNNANNRPLVGWALSAAGVMRLTFTSPPGATGVARVCYHSDDQMCYRVVSLTAYRPSILFKTGYAPTDYVVTLEWELDDEKYIVRADYGS